MNKVCLLFPNCNAARLLGIKLIDTQCSVVAYCMQPEDQKLGDNMLEEMSMCAMDQCHKLGLGSVLVGDKDSRFKIQTGEDFRDCDVLVLPSLDSVRTRPDREYEAMVEAHFVEMKRRGLQIKDGAKIIFGSNHGGLVAGAMWGKVFPEHKMQILAVSSLYEASIQVFGQESLTRAMPLERMGAVYFSDESAHTSEQHKRLVKMGMASDFDDYPTIESKLLKKIISLVLDDDLGMADNLGVIEIIGKYPTKEEARKWKRKEGEINWIPTNAELSWWDSFSGQKQNQS